ncbi:hypothetical protein F4604DRAFT_1763104 [Suillus subluteus]|nr:hypothetical protein F4604DRAFT_1763104 [Suillus subluteus]
MGYDFWQEDSELNKASRAEQLGFIDNGLSSSQFQQNFYLSLAPVNRDGDPPPVITQFHLMYGGGSTSNDHVPALAHLYDAGFSQSNSQFPSGLESPFLENDHRDIHIATQQPSHNTSFNHVRSPFFDDPSASNLGSSGNVSEPYPIESHPHPVHDNQSESHASDRLFVCRWNDGRWHGPCDKTANEGEIVSHVSLSHLPQLAGRTPMKCKWEGCKLQKSICRDTIIRHIRQIHLGIKPRRQSLVTSSIRITARSRRHPQPY